MKIIITGGTGWAGKAVIAACIANPSITSIIALSRRPIDKSLSATDKVHVVLMKSFDDYPEQILEELDRAEACIWCIGGKVEDFPDVETARHVGVDLTLVGAKAFLKHLAPSMPPGRKFMFAYCSGQGAEWDQSKSLWIYPDTRRIKVRTRNRVLKKAAEKKPGRGRKGLMDLAEANPKTFDVVVLRPGGILASNSLLAKTSSSIFVKISDLATAFVKVCLQPPNQKIIENADIIKLAN